jgi:hypothetical protein
MTYLEKLGLTFILVSPFWTTDALLDELSLCAKRVK